MTARLFMVEIVVADFARSRRWYSEFLGWRESLLDEARGFVLLEGDGRVALKLGRPQVGSVTPVFQVSDLQFELGRLQPMGICPDGPMKCSHEGYRRVFFIDPDGYRIGLFDWHQSDVNELNTNPVGSLG